MSTGTFVAFALMWSALFCVIARLDYMERRIKKLEVKR